MHPDIHAPGENSQLLSASLRLLKDFQPDYFVNLGDLIDAYAISSFNRDPARLLSLEEEIEFGKSYWKTIRSIIGKDAEAHYIGGNHEQRLQTYLQGKAPELSKLKNLTWEKLMDLDKYNVKFYKPHERLIFHGVFECTHGDRVRPKSGYSAHQEFEKRWLSGCAAHVHRLAKVFSTINGKTFCWCELGHMSGMDHGFEYLKGCKPNWQAGMGVAYLYQDDKDEWQVQIDLIEATPENGLFYNGKLYTEKGITTF